MTRTATTSKLCATRPGNARGIVGPGRFGEPGMRPFPTLAGHGLDLGGRIGDREDDRSLSSVAHRLNDLPGERPVRGRGPDQDRGLDLLDHGLQRVVVPVGLRRGEPVKAWPPRRYLTCTAWARIVVH